MVKQARNFVVINGILYFLDSKHHKLCYGSPHLQQQHHGGVMAGHFSEPRLYNTLCRHWWWKSMYPQALHPISVSCPFKILGVDIMELGPMLTTNKGNYYSISRFSDKMAFPTPDQKLL